MTSTKGNTAILGLTGASGTILVQTLLRLLDRGDFVDHVPQVVMETGQRSLTIEQGIAATETGQLLQLVSGRLPKEAKEV